MFKIVGLFFVTLFGVAFCLTDEEVKVKFIKLLFSCTEQHPVETSSLMSLQKYIVPKDTGTKCLLACVYRKTLVLDDNGKYSKEESYKYTEKIYEDNPTKIENGKKLTDMCLQVNDVPVSDGEKGCDRAALIFGCQTKAAPKLGFKM